MPISTANTRRPEIGSEIPSFSLPATKVGKIGSAELRGKPFVLYFYPKDETPGCTTEACSFRDALPNFSKMGVAVIGVSRDSLEKHERFSEKHNLQFPLASDEDGTVCKMFGVLKEKRSPGGKTSLGIERSTFLVDEKGILRAVWRNVSIDGHVDEIKKAVFKL